MDRNRAQDGSKIALITGTSSGIGLATAVRLGKAGFHVVATLRDVAKAGPLRERARSEGVEIEVRALDVSQPAAIEAGVGAVLAEHGRIDVLINNAGFGHLGTLEHTREEDLRRVFEVNFFGAWHTTRAVVGPMRKARSGRIITVSSLGGLLGQPFNDAYAAAKFAVEGWMESLAPVLWRFGVQVSLIEPGPVRTEFVTRLGPSLAERIADTADPYRPMLEVYLKASQERIAAIGQSAEDVAGVILEAATAEAPHFRYQTSEAVRGAAARKYVDPSGDSVLALVGARLDG